MMFIRPWTSCSQVRGTARVSPRCRTWLRSWVLLSQFLLGTWRCRSGACGCSGPNGAAPGPGPPRSGILQTHLRLQQIVIGPQAQGLDGAVQAGVPGEDDDLGLGGFGLDPGEQLQAGKAGQSSYPTRPGGIFFPGGPSGPPDRWPRQYTAYPCPRRISLSMLNIWGSSSARRIGSFSAIIANLRWKSGYPGGSCHRPPRDNPGYSAGPGSPCA